MGSTELMKRHRSGAQGVNTRTPSIDVLLEATGRMCPEEANTPEESSCNCRPLEIAEQTRTCASIFAPIAYPFAELTTSTDNVQGVAAGNCSRESKAYSFSAAKNGRVIARPPRGSVFLA